MREKRQYAHVCGKGGSTLARPRTPPGSELILSLEAWCRHILLPMHADNLVDWRWRGFQEATVHQTFCNNTRPIYTSHHMSDVQYSCFLCCTKLLFSVLYKTPVFSDVQYSWFQCCTILLFSVMYNIPDFSDVQYSFILRCTIFLFSM